MDNYSRKNSVPRSSKKGAFLPPKQHDAPKWFEALVGLIVAIIIIWAGTSVISEPTYCSNFNPYSYYTNIITLIVVAIAVGGVGIFYIISQPKEELK